MSDRERATSGEDEEREPSRDDEETEGRYDRYVDRLLDFFSLF